VKPEKNTSSQDIVKFQPEFVSISHGIYLSVRFVSVFNKMVNYTINIVLNGHREACTTFQNISTAVVRSVYRQFVEVTAR
jgi:hypothetical protein